MAIEYLRGGIFLFVGDEGRFDSLVSRGYYSPVPDHEIPYDLRLEIQDRLDARGVKGSSARQSTGTNEAGKNCWAPNKPCGKACRVNCKSGSGTVGAKTKKAAQQMVSEALAKKKGAAGGKKAKSAKPSGPMNPVKAGEESTPPASKSAKSRKSAAPKSAKPSGPMNPVKAGEESTPPASKSAKSRKSAAPKAAKAKTAKPKATKTTKAKAPSRQKQLEAQLAADPFFADIMRRRRDSRYDSFGFIPYYATTGLPTLVDPFGAFR